MTDTTRNSEFARTAEQFNEHENPNKLAYRKSFEVNAASLFSAHSDHPEEASPIIVQQSTVLGVQSQYGLAKPTDNDAEIEKQVKKVTNGNPQRVDQAFLPLEHDTLIYRFTARANGDQNLPIESSSSSSLVEHLANMARNYSKAGGFTYLGTLMAANIADARFAFRNRAAESVSTKVTIREASKASESNYQPTVFTFALDASDSPFLDPGNSIDPVQDAKVKELGELIGKGLAGKELILIDVECALKVGPGQEVYPSQEMIDDSSDTAPSRVYYKDSDTGQAKVHSQKIGNGIRQIDIWHPEVAKYGPLPAEAYGNFARRAVAVRLKNNFYKSILKPEFKSLKAGKPTPLYEKLEDANTQEDLHNIQDAHFFMAIMMRGGVFGMKDN